METSTKEYTAYLKRQYSHWKANGKKRIGESSVGKYLPGFFIVIWFESESKTFFTLFVKMMRILAYFCGSGTLL